MPRPVGLLRSLLVLSLSALGACHEADSPAEPPGPRAAVFVVRTCLGTGGPPDGERFRVRIDDPAVATQAEALVGAGPLKVLSGTVVRGDGAVNAPWSWHLDPASIQFVDASIELCDACPSYLEQRLDDWIRSGGSYCPWTTEVVARVQ